SGTSVMERIRQAAQHRVGKWVVRGLIATGITGAAYGTAEAVHAVRQHDRAQFEATQGQISPVIARTMIDVDRQTLDQQRSNPDDITEIDAPNGHNDAVRFINKTRNADVIMGTTDGKPDPE